MRILSCSSELSIRGGWPTLRNSDVGTPVMKAGMRRSEYQGMITNRLPHSQGEVYVQGLHEWVIMDIQALQIP